MKQIPYSVFILFALVIAFFFRGETPVGEHDVKFLFKNKGCNLYQFKVLDGIKYKSHFYADCGGAVFDTDDITVTEVGQ
jgi:hypothetical protein